MCRTRQFWSLSVAVIVIALLILGGCTTTHYSMPYGEGARATIIVVDSDAVVPDPVSLSKNHKHQAEWYSWPGSTLAIRFDDPSLFPRLSCKGNRCSSGPIAEGAVYKPYPYHASVDLAEKKASLDPTIMIDP